MSIMFISALVVFLIFGIALFMAMREIKQLKDERTGLLGKICLMKSERASKLLVVLTLAERQIILGALKTPQYKEWVTAPATKHLIRTIYHALVKKIKEGIRTEWTEEGK